MKFFSGILLAVCFIACANANNKSNNNLNSTMNNNEEKSPSFGGTKGGLDTALFGAGCFWCVEAVFQQLEGVESVTSGYSGGHIVNPTYEEVCSKTSGHVEVTKIVFDTTKISYDELLEVFWKTHDPTTIDQQGADKGPQYRSVVFYYNDAQKQKAEYYKQEINNQKLYPNPIVTAIEPAQTFYPAEAYHQNYYNENPDQMYCRYVIQPKLEKFEKLFKDKMKKN